MARMPVKMLATSLIALGAVKDEAVVENGSVTVAKMLRVCATFDHRVLDGMHAAKMAKTLKRIFADPEKELDPNWNLETEFYVESVTFVIPLKVADGTPNGRHQLKVTAAWQTCNDLNTFLHGRYVAASWPATQAAWDGGSRYIHCWISPKG